MSDWTRHLNLKRWETSPEPHFKTLLVTLWIFVIVSLPTGWMISRAGARAEGEMGMKAKNRAAAEIESPETYKLINLAHWTSSILQGIFIFSGMGIGTISFVRGQFTSKGETLSESRES